MKKLAFLTVCVLLQAVMCLLCFANAETEYNFDAIYLENEQALSVSLDVSYTNETGSSLESVLFNVYANLFRRESTLPFDNASLESAFPYGYVPSGIELTRVCYENKDARYRFLGANECYMRVDCALEAGQTGAFHFEYTLLLSQNRSFQGISEDIRVSLFYPSVCAYDGEFVTEAASRAAQFLYAESANFEMNLYLPAGYIIASGAETTLIEQGEAYDIYNMKLSSANEFALAFSRRYRVYSKTLTSGHTITVYGSDRGKCKTALNEAARSLETYEQMFGSLSRKHTNVVLSDSAVSYAYPGLIILGDDADEMSVAYMMAQQYFGCSVLYEPGSDPFLRYGISYYAALLSLEKLNGEAAFRDALTKYVQPALKLTIPGSLTPDSALSRFTTVYDFDIVVKLRGAAVMHEMREIMGRDEFISALRRFYQSENGKISGFEAFVEALNRDSGAYGSALVAWLMTIDDYSNHSGDIYR